MVPGSILYSGRPVSQRHRARSLRGRVRDVRVHYLPFEGEGVGTGGTRGYTSRLLWEKECVGNGYCRHGIW